MSFYDEVVVPYCIELTCGMKDLVAPRQATTSGLVGRVLEIGFGSGLNVGLYPKEVTRILAVEPSMRARKIGKKRIDAAAQPIEFVGLDAQRLAIDDASADSALTTFTLCTIPEAEQALREVRRVLVPGGALHFLEHGRSPDANVARWQDRLNGIQQFVCGGCNVNRDIASIVERAGFEIESVEKSYFPKGPKTHSYLFRGVARC